MTELFHTIPIPVLEHNGMQLFCSAIISKFILFSPVAKTSACALWAKSLSSIVWISSAVRCMFTWEQNGKIGYIQLLVLLFIPPLSGAERCYLKQSRVNATLERSRRGENRGGGV